MPYRIFLPAIFVMLLIASSVHADENTRLMVAWRENDKIMVWHTNDLAPTAHTAPENVIANARKLMISSDGHYIVLTSAMSSSLWLITPTDPDMVEILPNTPFPSTDSNTAGIDILQRGANAAFYFSTYDKPAQYVVLHNDLWLFDAAARTYKQLLPSPLAGLFSLSPDNQHFAISTAGVYNQTEGTIGLVDANGQNRRDSFTFPAISSASDFGFYPQAFWESNSAAFNIAIPDKDLIYNDNTALTTLWHVAVDGSKTQRGTVQATIFALPEWSYDGSQIVYIRRIGDLNTNQLELIVANGDGSNPVIYASDKTGAMGAPHWLVDSNRFIYQQGEPDYYWIGQSGQPARGIASAFKAHFVDDNTYVYTSPIGTNFELRYSRLDSETATIIASIQNDVPLFDAILIP